MKKIEYRYLLTNVLFYLKNKLILTIFCFIFMFSIFIHLLLLSIDKLPLFLIYCIILTFNYKANQLYTKKIKNFFLSVIVVYSILIYLIANYNAPYLLLIFINIILIVYYKLEFRIQAKPSYITVIFLLFIIVLFPTNFNLIVFFINLLYPALIEEILFRFCLFKFIDEKIMNLNKSVLIQAIIFASLHALVYLVSGHSIDINLYFSIIHLFLGGYVLGKLFVNTHSIIICTIVHAMMNAFL